MLGMLAEWLVREWGGAFSTVGGPDRAVCFRVKATTEFACVAKLAVFAIGARGPALELNRPQTFAVVV